MAMTLIVIEGCDGTGTTTHTEKLGYALAATLGDDRVRVYRHPPHRPGAGDWERSLHYARERAEMIAREGEGRIIVCDRWVHSTDAIALALRGDPIGSRMLALSALERATLPQPVLTVMLDAPDAVLDARLTARGEPLSPLTKTLRGVYRASIGPRCDAVLSTSDDADAVKGRLVTMATKQIKSLNRGAYR